MSDADALVIGAGPAGSLAALMLARAGVRVRLLDRARFPRHKLCGDTLNPGSLSILESVDSGLQAAGFGPRGSLADLVRAGALAITGMTVTGPAGARVAADYPRDLRGASLTRADLDSLLLEAALGAGVAFDDGVVVTGPHTTADGARVDGVRVASRHHDCSMRARIVIAADGRASKLASALKLSAFAASPRRWAFGAYFTDVAGMTSRGEMHVRPDGYIGIAPLLNGLINVCVVRTMAPGRRVEPIDQRRIIIDVVRGDATLRERFASARQASDVTVLGPLAVHSRASGCAGLLLAGDAAGFVDPMTGDGLRFALRGGALAAEAALSELASGAPAFRRLHDARTREFSRKWQFNRALRALVGSPRAVQAAALVTTCWQTPVRYLVGVAGDVGIAGASASA